MRIKTLLAGLSGSLLIAVGMPLMASAAATTSVVTPTGTQGWIFNPDPTNATPYEFNNNKSSIGAGSLFVNPIDATPAHKFIAAKPLNIPAASLSSVSYDFLIAGNGTAASANQFYLNVYANLPGSTTYYDCRFDHVPATGSTTNFTNATFLSANPASAVDDRFNGTARPDDGYNCPTSLAQMAIDRPGSTVSAITLNLGDTSAFDAGLAGYYDKVVTATSSDTTTYDFEVALSAPTITVPANNSTLTSAQLVRVDWTDVTGATLYEYEAYTDATYTTPIYDSGMTLTVSEIPTPGSPQGTYYVRVRAQDAAGNTSAWSNGVTNPYTFTVNNTQPPVLTYPSTKDSCKKNGWSTFTGARFKNQGDCVSYVATGGTNLPSY